MTQALYRVLPPCRERARELVEAHGLSEPIAEVLVRRGISDPDAAGAFLDPRLQGLSPPDDLADLPLAVERLVRAIRGDERVVVFGDYDVDGTTSATIVGGVIRQLGGQAEVLAANRFSGGYGFSEDGLARCLEHDPSVIVTCDCGSSDHARIEAAQQKGIDVLVIDHHLVPDEPLPARAFLNPHRPDCGFPYKGLASAGLALLVAAGLRKAMGAKLDLREWLDLVAIGTIADVAPLDGDNRRLVRAGLKRLESGLMRPGVQALFEAGRIKRGSPVGAVDIAFRIAPRLNAPGRLEDPALTVALLQAGTLQEARMLAARVEQINDARKKATQKVIREAELQVQELYGSEPDSGVVLASPNWHRGVVGIAASRVVERFGVPAVIIGIDGLGHGSGRAPEGFRLYDALSECREHLETMGGHQAAAGLSVATTKLDDFRAAFTTASRELGAGSLRGSQVVWDVEAEVNPGGGSGPSFSEVRALEPLGKGNPEPVFAFPAARLVSKRQVGDGHLSMQLGWEQAELRAFGYGMWSGAKALPETLCPLGYLRPDGWRNDGSLEIHLVAPDAKRA